MLTNEPLQQFSGDVDPISAVVTPSGQATQLLELDEVE